MADGVEVVDTVLERRAVEVGLIDMYHHEVDAVVEGVGKVEER